MAINHLSYITIVNFKSSKWFYKHGHLNMKQQVANIQVYQVFNIYNYVQWSVKLNAIGCFDDEYSEALLQSIWSESSRTLHFAHFWWYNLLFVLFRLNFNFLTSITNAPTPTKYMITIHSTIEIELDVSQLEWLIRFA